MSTVTSEHRRRLSYVRYLYNVAVDQSHRPEPDASFSVLPFHDASEMFLQIVAEHRGVILRRGKFPSLLEYWRLLKDQGVDVPYQMPMQRLNEARNKLKHAGLLPHQTDVESFRATVTSFLQETSAAAMGLQFDQISLTRRSRSRQAQGRGSRGARRPDLRSDFGAGRESVYRRTIPSLPSDTCGCSWRCRLPRDVCPRIAEPQKCMVQGNRTRLLWCNRQAGHSPYGWGLNETRRTG
jgi:hypothetical protein